MAKKKKVSRKKTAGGKKATKRKKKVSRLKKGTWTKEELRILKKEFPNSSCATVAKKLSRPLFAVKKKAYRLGVYKTKRYLKSIGRA